MKQKINFLTVLFVILATTFISAQSISIQGILREANGLAVQDGPYDMTFKIYDVENGGTALWTEDQNSVPIKNGLYSVYLGEDPLNLIPATAFENEVAYVGVTVGGAEMQPRIKITHAPYTYASQNVVCSGAVGDVKYSILDPVQFAAVNGDCWVPMDGQSIVGSALETLMGISAVPDMSGQFMRAHEYNDGTDPDRTPSTPIASAQTDAFESHAHDAGSLVTDSKTVNINDRYISSTATTGSCNTTTSISMSSNGWSSYMTNTYETSGGACDGIRFYTSNSNRSSSHSHTVTGTSDSAGGAETRPKNRSFYAYIRIN